MEEKPDDEEDAVEELGTSEQVDTAVQVSLDDLLAAEAAAEQRNRVDDSDGAESRDTCRGRGGRGGGGIDESTPQFKEGLDPTNPTDAVPFPVGLLFAWCPETETGLP